MFEVIVLNDPDEIVYQGENHEVAIEIFNEQVDLGHEVELSDESGVIEKA